MITSQSTQRLPARPPAEDERRARGRCPKKRAVIQAARIQPGAQPDAQRRAAARRPGSCVVESTCAVTLTPLLESTRILHEGVELVLGQRRNGGMTPSGEPGWTYAFGSTIDSLDELLERLRPPAWRRPASLSRSGPTFPVAPGGLEACGSSPQPLLSKTALPGLAGRPVQRLSLVLQPARRRRPAPSRSPSVRISAWPRPQSSVQITGIRADLRRRDHELGVLTGQRILLLPELGNPERVDHVVRGQVQLDRPAERETELRRGQVLLVRIRELHANWRAVTSTFSGFEPVRSFWARTMPLITEIAVTRTPGPPSRRSRARCARGSAARPSRRPGATRNFTRSRRSPRRRARRSRCRSRS